MSKVFDHRTILVVDDDLTTRNVTLHMLKLLSADLRLRVASDGKQCLAAVREQVPDIIILDLMMPELDGYATLRQLRSDPATAYVPVAVLTAFGDETLKNDLTLNGCDAFLHKPVKSLELIAIMHALMRTRRRYEKLEGDIALVERRYANLVQILEERLGNEKTNRLIRQAAVKSTPRATLAPVMDDDEPDPSKGEEDLP